MRHTPMPRVDLEEWLNNELKRKEQQRRARIKAAARYRRAKAAREQVLGEGEEGHG